MQSAEQILEFAFPFHGHRCPAMPLGIRVGLAAMRALGVERASNKELYCICETGEIVVLRAGGDKFEVLFESKTGETPIQSSISIANGRLFIRTAENLHCIGK